MNAETVGVEMTSPSAMLVIQDEIYEGSLHLDEVMLSAIPSAIKGAGSFAFATQNGINAIFNSNEFRDYCHAGNHFELILGIDSVTNDKALIYAKKLSDSLDGRLIVKVYYDESASSIFHPKTTWFANKPDINGGSMFVGSGNLTLNGLQNNVEMFSWIELDQLCLAETMSTWSKWLHRANAAHHIYAVDDPFILERANANSSPLKKGTKHVGDRTAFEETKQLLLSNDFNVIVSSIPRQTDRGWTQFAMKKEYYTGFFGFSTEDTPEAKDVRVLLRAVNSDSSLQLAESRTGNISRGSRNYRIELDGARNIEVANDDNPIVVIVKTGPREYLYEVFDSTSGLLGPLAKFAQRINPNLPKNQKPKCLTTVKSLRESFPDLPILNVKDDGDA